MDEGDEEVSSPISAFESFFTDWKRKNPIFLAFRVHPTD